MSEQRPAYKTAPPVQEKPAAKTGQDTRREAKCECGFPFGIVYVVDKRPMDAAPYRLEYLALYGCALTVTRLECKCPCGKKFVFEGKREG